MLPLYQVVLNLTGESKNILDMYTGEAMDYRTKIGWMNRDGEIAQWSYSLSLYVYCQEWEKATEMYNKLIDKDIGFLRSFPMWHNRVFFFAIVAIYNATRVRLLKKRNYTRAIENHIKLIRRWVVERNAINLVHKLQLLEAMQLTLRRRYPSDQILIPAFEKAILVASRSGYFQDAGLAASLAAWAIQDKDKRVDFASVALGAFRKWGAEGVVQHLESTSSLYREASHFNSASMRETGALRSRERFEVSTRNIRGLLER
jgi:tetratricopeptide (TPR) repeat protein